MLEVDEVQAQRKHKPYGVHISDEADGGESPQTDL